MNIEELNFRQLYIYIKNNKIKHTLKLIEINKDTEHLPAGFPLPMQIISSYYTFKFEIIDNSDHTFVINLNEGEVTKFLHEKQKYEAQFLNTIKDIYE